MKVKNIADIKVLLPNPEHQNFVDSNEVIKANTIIEGEPKIIAGKRRGEPFNYKLFLTNDNKLIKLKNLRTMANATEVTLGADGEATPIKVNLKQTVLAKPGVLGAVLGATVGYGISKYKKHESGKKIMTHVIVGAIAGYVAGHIVAHTAKITK
jgi:hypothetical protein